MHLLTLLSTCLPKEVARKRMVMVANPTHSASTNLNTTVVPAIRENILERITLLARKRVMVTETTRKMFAQPFCGEAPMNWGSLRQRRRQMEKNGRRQPLKTWAMRITKLRSAANIHTCHKNTEHKCTIDALA